MEEEGPFIQYIKKKGDKMRSMRSQDLLGNWCKYAYVQHVKGKQRAAEQGC